MLSAVPRAVLCSRSRACTLLWPPSKEGGDLCNVAFLAVLPRRLRVFSMQTSPRARTRRNRTTSFVVHNSAVLGPIRVIGNELQSGETAVLSVLTFYPLSFFFFLPPSSLLLLSGSSHPSVELGSRERPSRIHGRAAWLRQSFPKSLYDGRRRDATPKSFCSAEPSWKTLERSAGSNYECTALSAAVNGASAHARACVTKCHTASVGGKGGEGRDFPFWQLSLCQGSDHENIAVGYVFAAVRAPSLPPARV